MRHRPKAFSKSRRLRLADEQKHFNSNILIGTAK